MMQSHGFPVSYDAYLRTNQPNLARLRHVALWNEYYISRQYGYTNTSMSCRWSSPLSLLSESSAQIRNCACSWECFLGAEALGGP